MTDRGSVAGATPTAGRWRAVGDDFPSAGSGTLRGARERPVRGLCRKHAPVIQDEKEPSGISKSSLFSDGKEAPSAAGKAPPYPRKRECRALPHSKLRSNVRTAREPSRRRGHDGRRAAPSLDQTVYAVSRRACPPLVMLPGCTRDVPLGAVCWPRGIEPSPPARCVGQAFICARAAAPVSASWQRHSGLNLRLRYGVRH